MAWQGLLGIPVILAVAWVLGERQRRIPWRIVGGGLGLQVALAVLLLWLPLARELFSAATVVVDSLQTATRAGTSFVFGYVGGGEAPFETSVAGRTFILAFQALPLILLVSALSALLFYWRILPPIVRGFAWALGRGLGIGGAVGAAAAANVFVGMVEAPLLIRPYLRTMSRGGLFAVMTCGMATIAGTVFVVYATILSPVLPDAAGHLLTASLINAPAALAIAAVMIPPEGEPREVPTVSAGDVHSSMEAVVKGTVDGVPLLINVTAMLVVMVALVSLANQILGLLPDVGGAALTLQRGLGWVAAPLAWLIGIPWAEAVTAGGLIGTKVVLNEFIAYVDLAGTVGEALSEKSRLILAYALCGFSNIGSLGIMIGGLTTMAPDRRADIIALGPRTLVSGLLASCLTAAVVGLIV
jgi:CNT family concentrative nucleoside transporter